MSNIPIDQGDDKNAGFMKRLEVISEKCIECNLCQSECAFLRKHGKPKAIADRCDSTLRQSMEPAFECSLCGLCGAVCPVGINPTCMMLDMRREAVCRGWGSYSQHSGILNYEKLGTSRLLTQYVLPRGSDTVFFPGCALSGTRPDRTLQLFNRLRETVPRLGIVLDCCTRPSHDLGRSDYFHFMFGEMRAWLTENGIRTVLTACPSCFGIFDEYGGELSVKTAYEVLAEGGFRVMPGASGTVTVHDPCATRLEPSIHTAVRALVESLGLNIHEMPHHKEKTLCCGEGGAVRFLNPELAGRWAMLRKEEAQGLRIITYCAGCTDALGAAAPTSHLLDLLFEPEAALAGRVKVFKSPMTYWNRFRLRRLVKRMPDAEATGERGFRQRYFRIL